ncbi:restriction endonuclease subunit S [Actinobacillus pleuropneumoniae]|uniref:Putative type I restriction system specificity protein n=2 Tax=Actinobacillus pleuropneumoniae TaxID=715 RepID=A3N000_ACTP2|nr:restriction endonuclease subunit S [Actinobacillus pleuropneumoniae]ABN73736.1 putative type I restriction system specificity protein [Actinobacillus pleuropneumoniae serovar 5b str. L20]UPK79145.1 restriction endonuclease subunit S [Actinobacillus pleuropneumoniae]
MAKLGDIADIVMGQSPSSSDVNMERIGDPLLNGPTEFTSFYPSPVQYTEKGKKFAEKGDLLFCVRGSTTGRINFADQKYAIGRGLAAIRGKNGYPTKFIELILKDCLERILQSATGSTFPNVSQAMLLDLDIGDFSLPEAIKIADILGIIDHKIHLNTQTNQTLEQIAQAIFKSWFVDFEPVKAKMQGGNLAVMEAISGKNSEELHRLQTENPTEYQKLWAIADAFPDEIGEDGIPVGWENVYLKDVCNIVYGKNLPIKKLQEFGYPVFGGNGIIGFYEKFLYEEPHTLVSCRGAASGKVMYSQPYSFVTNNSLVIEHSKSFLSYFYIYEALRIQTLVELTTGSAQPQMTIANMNPVQIILPTDKIHNLYTSQVKYLYEKIYRNNLENEQLEKIRDELLPKLLNGDLCNTMDN